MSRKKKKEEAKLLKAIENMDFRVSADGMHRFFVMSDFDEEDIEACVDFFEKFVKEDFPRYLKAQPAIRGYVNAALCVGDDDLRDQRVEVLGCMDQFMMDLADFRCRFADGY